jgi:hypothetical protein
MKKYACQKHSNNKARKLEGVKALQTKQKKNFSAFLPPLLQWESIEK